jgi:hypothetical protein
LLDRYIGIAGLILGLLSLIAPYRWPKVPQAYTTAGLYLAILLVGLAVGSFISTKFGGQGKEPAKDVSLFLQFSDDHTVPKEVRNTNVKSWYALYTQSIYVDALDVHNQKVGGFGVPPRWSIFILFSQPVEYRQMLASCAGPETMKCTVQYSGRDYAIVTIEGNVTKGTLDVSVTPS